MKRRKSSLVLRRGNQRGAAVFVVLMAIMLLTSLGAWVVYAGGQTALASGYARASSQTLYIAEAGIIATTAAMAQPGGGAAHYGVENDVCYSVDVAADGAKCKATILSDLNDNVTFPATGFNVLEQIANEGSLGPTAGVLEGSFRVEMAERRNADVGGEGVGSGAYKRVVLTSYGVVRPPAGADLCTPGTESQNSSATRVAVRAHAIIGPTNQ